jgi:hypothetical protein
MSYPDLEKEASMMGDSISHQAFYRYFKHKKQVNIKARLRSKYLRAEDETMGIRQGHNKSINIIDEINRNLWTLQTLTQNIIANSPTNYQSINACTNLLKETRQTLQYLDKKRKDMMLESETSEEMGIATLLELLAGIPSDCPSCGIDLGIVSEIHKKLEALK